MSPLEELIASMVDALVGRFRMPKFRQGRTTTSSPVTQSTQSTTQSSRQALETAGTLYFTALNSLASSAPTSSNMQESGELSLSKGEPTEEEQRDPDYCWTHKKIEKKEEEE